MSARPSVPVLSFALATLAAAASPALAWGQQPATHTVKKGDTLWDIARTYLGDPFLWPQIYRANTDVVEDPHWIYPGEVLRLTAAPGASAVPPQETPAPAPAAEPQAPAAEPAPGDDSQGMELFRRRRVTTEDNSFSLYRDVKTRPLGASAFYAAGFLTEGDSLPFGTLLGPIVPEQIETVRGRAAVQLLTRVGVRAPAAASYAAGDSLVVAEVREGPVGYGAIIVPTGILRVTGPNGPQFVAEVVQIFGPIREGQVVYPAEKFADPGAVEYQKVADGIQGRILVPRDLRELRHPEHVLFLDVGRAAGVQEGDLFEARRDAGPQNRSLADAVEERMATLQVVHVRGRTATARVVSVLLPDIRPGTRVVQVGRLPR